MPQEKDRLRLRELANRQLEYAHSPRNDEILKQWQALSQGRRESPTVRLLFSNFTDEEEKKLIDQLVAIDETDEIGLDIVRRIKYHHS